jgi:hypothetical protein
MDAINDVDSPINVIDANFHARGWWISLKQWASLPPASQELWDKLPDESKALILGSAKKLEFRKANVHDQVTNHDGDAFMDTSSQLDEDEAYADDDNPEPEPKENDSDTLLANATNHHGSIPASDICKVLSSTIKGKTGMTAPPPALKQSILIDGKKFISANLHVTYSISSHQCSNDRGALIDRGANGGIAGSDVCIIEKVLESNDETRTVDVCGIDNHGELTSIPIVNDGGVVLSQHGKVIAIMNQYAYTGRSKSIHSS